jgi:CRP-like cAMP-binding protein
MPTARTELIHRIPIFAGLEPEVIEAIAERAASRTIAHGEVLFNEGDPCEGVFLVVDGSVKIFKTSPSGRPFQVSRSRLRRTRSLYMGIQCHFGTLVLLARMQMSGVKTSAGAGMP